MNTTDKDREIVIRHNDVCTAYTLSAHSISTVLF
jgi:hypothetical protein